MKEETTNLNSLATYLEKLSSQIIEKAIMNRYEACDMVNQAATIIRTLIQEENKNEKKG